MDRAVHTVIDAERCIGCGLCVRGCPSATLAMRDGKAVVAGQQSLACGHCVAICPTNAVRLSGLEIAPGFRTFATTDAWLPHGDIDLGQLVRLMRSRRSCRNYTTQVVDRSMLQDLVHIGITAPSGTNSQRWTFTVLADRQEVEALGDRIALYFKGLNRLAARPLARWVSKLFGNDALGRYYRTYSKTVAQGLQARSTRGEDHLFHGATAAIIVGSLPGASCPHEDALLATQNILLGAHGMGLGSCLIGFAVAAMQRDPLIKQSIGIPAGEPVYVVIGLGHPDERYQQVTHRLKPITRFSGTGEV